jgi:hypothetical protein
VVVPFGTEQQYRIVTDSQGNVVDEIPVDKVAPGLLESALQQIPMYNLAKQIVAGGRTYDTETLATVLKDRILGRSPVEVNSAGEALPFNAASALASYAGLPIRQFDLPSYQANLARGAGEAATSFEKTRGVLGALPAGATSVPPALRSQSRPDPFQGLF